MKRVELCDVHCHFSYFTKFSLHEATPQSFDFTYFQLSFDKLQYNFSIKSNICYVQTKLNSFYTAAPELFRTTNSSSTFNIRTEESF